MDASRVEQALGYAEEGDRKALEAMTAGMSEADRAYMLGYVDGYVAAVQAYAQAEGVSPERLTGCTSPS